MAAFPPAPRDLPSDDWQGARSFARQMAAVVNRLLQGKLNAVYRVAGGDFTLAANTTTTMLTDPRLSVGSHVGFLPLTANAAAELGAGALYAAPAGMNNGAWTITHANNAQTDRTFRILIIG